MTERQLNYRCIADLPRRRPAASGKNMRMTHRRTRTLIQAVLAVMIVAMALVAAPTPARAGTQWDEKISVLKNGGRITIYEGFGLRRFSCKSQKVSGLRSSNEKVVMVGKRKGLDDDGTKVDCIYIRGVKPGRAKVSFTYKGKRRTVTVVVKKFVSPVASLRVGGEDVARYLTSGFKTLPITMNCAGKTLSIKPKKGWKVKMIYVGVDLGKNRVEGYKRLKNGAKMPKNSIGDIDVLFTRPSNGGVNTIGLYIKRP